ncbi:MAG: NAD(P)/FAD-dependent oxidoreductase [Desulfobacter sp.]
MDAIIIGAGISGLSCARSLMDAGMDVLILEAGSGIGGRIKSDVVDGFILDHGFQVLQTAYPEARRQLDFKDLDLQSFLPGVGVRIHGKVFYISDPLRRPQDLWCTLTAPVGNFMDRLRILRLLWNNRQKGLHGIFASRDMHTMDFLKAYGFSDNMAEQFFRPFFAGACLDPEIKASSRVFRYLFDIFASGDATLPARGMATIPAQLARDIPAEKIRLNAKVLSVENDGVVLDSNERIKASNIVIATQGPETEKLLKRETRQKSIGEKCLYYSAKTPPVSRPALLLNGHKSELINNIAVPSLTAPTYSSSGDTLVAVVVLGNPELSGSRLEQAVRKELVHWFGNAVSEWRHIKTYDIRHALPDQSPPAENPLHRKTKAMENIYTCGEYRNVPGLQWALLSGRLTAEQVIRDCRGK